MKNNNIMLLFTFPFEMKVAQCCDAINPSLALGLHRNGSVKARNQPHMGVHD